MTLTHLSHFDLAEIAKTTTGVVLEGSLAACKRMAFAHGMEIERYEGFTVGIEGGRATCTPADNRNFSFLYFKQGGLIQKTRDGYCLVIPIRIWEND